MHRVPCRASLSLTKERFRAQALATTNPEEPPKNEVERLALLHSYGILDTEPESGLDDIARLASAICDTPIALITLVDRDRQWFKARVGLEIPETSRASSFCAYAIADAHQPLIVHDTWDDARFVDNPLVVGDPNIRFYAGVPLVDDGHALGTLCVIDHAPRVLSAKQLDSLVLLARQAASELGRSKHRRGSERPLTGASSLPRAIDSAVIAGRYRIEDVIGIGGMGIVVGATDLRNERPVAVKFLLPESSHELSWKRFHAEFFNGPGYWGGRSPSHEGPVMSRDAWARTARLRARGACRPEP